MPPTPLDGKPLPLDSPDRPPAVLRRLADGAGQPVLRQGAGQPRLAQLPGPRPGRGRGRPAPDQPADQPGAVRRPGEGLRRSQIRCQTPDSPDHELGGLSAVVEGRRPGNESRRSVLLALPGPPAAGRGDAGRLLAGDGRADAVHAVGVGGGRLDDGLQRLPAGDAGDAAAGFAGGVAVSGGVRPAGARGDLLLRAAGRLQRRPGAARQQRPDAQRQAARPQGPRRGVAEGERRRTTRRCAGCTCWR